MNTHQYKTYLLVGLKYLMYGYWILIKLDGNVDSCALLYNESIDETEL